MGTRSYSYDPCFALCHVPYIGYLQGPLHPARCEGLVQPPRYCVVFLKTACSQKPLRPKPRVCFLSSWELRTDGVSDLDGTLLDWKGLEEY